VTTEFREHEIQWTRELSARFWDHLARSNVRYFSDETGQAIIRAVQRSGVPLTGRILDFGCGPGHLVAHLVRQRIACEGVDFSADSVSQTNKRLGGNAFFKGASQIYSIPTDLKTVDYDLIFCIETIEHVLQPELNATFQELHRLLRPNGFLIVTTPNDEALDESKVICPECGCIFHRMQHVHSWNKISISAFLESLSFSTYCCEAQYFHQSSIWGQLRKFASRIRGRRMPNLLYIGQKRSV
jgi:2-polyprenyl-3-methyl-5-hydroxy-6-metoxy-1,4-benzoquinol methylase